MNSKNCTCSQCPCVRDLMQSVSSWESRDVTALFCGQSRGLRKTQILVSDVADIFHAWWSTYRRQCENHSPLFPVFQGLAYE